jgi:uncharacterized protein (DUF1330 family)
VRVVPVYALNLFDLADNDLYRQYSRRSADAVGRYGGRVVALGKLREGAPQLGDTPPRTAMIVVEWPSQEAFDSFLNDSENEDLHPLREGGTRNYLWWLYDSLEDLRPLFAATGPA